MQNNQRKNYKRAKTAGSIIMAVISAVLPFWKSFLFPVSIVTVWVAILLLASEFSKESIWKSFVIPTALMIFCALSVFVYQIYFSKPNFATPESLTPAILQNMTIRIGDLVREESIIRNKTFDNCHIYGPAMIVPRHCIKMGQLTLAEIDPNGVFVETKNRSASGAIWLDNCVIKDCTFHKISFIGSPADLVSVKKEFGIED